MKTLFRISSMALMTAAFVACSQQDLYVNNGGDTNTEVNGFDFSTVQTPNVSISYKNTGFEGSTASVFFQLYSENPVDAEGKLKANLNPVYVGYTDENGEWSGKVELPAFATEVYAYTPSKLASTLVSASINGGKATLVDIETETRAPQAQSSSVKTGLYSNAVSDYGWKTWLGEYSSTGKDNSKKDFNKLSGGISYENVFANNDDKKVLNVEAKTATSLLSVHQKVIEVTQPCPVKYRTSKDLKVSKDAAVAVTMLGGNTGWSSSMAYYYYNENDVPTSLDQVHPILIFPNTQDGMYSDPTKSKANLDKANNAKGVERGTTVQLYYYGPADNMSEAQKSATFPAGTRIGFVLKGHAWNDGNVWNCDGKSPNAAKNEAPAHFSTSTPGLNTKSSNLEVGSGVAMYTPDDEHVLLSFEDHNNDDNFSDVVFTLTSNPVGSFSEVTTLDDIETSNTIQKGVYAFEDLWPARGDYDMNDVVVEASAKKVMAQQNKQYAKNGVEFKTISSDKYLKSESFTLTPYQNYAVNQNGLAFTFVPSEGVALNMIESAKLTIDGKDANFKVEDGVYYLVEDVKDCLGKDICLTITYKAPTFNASALKYEGSYVDANAQSSIKPFIYRSGNNGNWEVHITNEAPTAKADLSYFGTGDDKTDLTKGNYYTRCGNYPFAFFLSGSTIADFNAILERSNESTPINELYPTFINWSQSCGAECKSWYKSISE